MRISSLVLAGGNGLHELMHLPDHAHMLAAAGVRLTVDGGNLAPP